MIQNNIIPIGAMVLLKDDLAPSLKWSLGRVVEVKPGKDGIVRVLKVQTAGGVYDRAISGVAILPQEE